MEDKARYFYFLQEKVHIASIGGFFNVEMIPPYLFPKTDLEDPASHCIPTLVACRIGAKR